MSTKELGLFFYRLSNGAFVIARQNPDFNLSNPMFVTFGQMDEKTGSRPVKLTPMIEILYGLTAIDDNWFFTIKKEDVTMKTYPSKFMIDLYNKTAKALMERQNEVNKTQESGQESGAI